MLKKILLFVLLVGMPVHVQAAEAPRNVIFMVMDGTNSDVVTLSRLYKGKALALDSILVGGVKTFSLESAITDSAAAGTALATGQKTVIDLIGMVPQPSGNPRPVANLLEASQEKGLATGIVSTSPVQHATPAAFSAHVLNRNQFQEIANQQAHQGIDVIFGGGRKYAAKNPRMIVDRTALYKARGPKQAGYFADEDMAYDFDRVKLHQNQPSLQEMTRKAIEVLNKQQNGFFLFIEGSKVDFAAHKNDPVGMISEVLAFDSAVEETLNFAKKNKNTLLIAVTDHGNSGLTIGNRDTNRSYAQSPATTFIAPLKKARLSVTGALSQLKKDRSNLETVLRNYGLDGLSKQQLRKFARSEDLETDMVQELAKRAKLGFTTNGHTGEDVFLYAYGPAKPTGLVNNTDLSGFVVRHLGLDPLDRVTAKRFTPAKEHFEKLRFKTKIVHGEEGKVTFIAEKDRDIIEFPANENVRVVNGKRVAQKGLNVFNGKEFFVPRE